ncbi:7865_t:CDS:2 [Dentiscutata erythropus]|uniref:7865_t:CDS:1 n=1 Tax=Dentiscutata erythropus TaxID=1348616 RepID=A0A9N9NDC4_9GLOM|nr:7865_t:CDS:2 [Dentiscutata erythropus]
MSTWPPTDPVTIHDTSSSNFWTSKDNDIVLETGSSKSDQNWNLIQDDDDATIIYITQDSDEANLAITYDPNNSTKFVLKAYVSGNTYQQFVVSPASADKHVNIACKNKFTTTSGSTTTTTTEYAIAKSGDVKDSKIGPGTNDSKQWIVDTQA